MDVSRQFWIGFGAVNQLLFGVTVLRLFVFLKGGEGFRAWLSPGVDQGFLWIWIDCALAVQFAVLHSAMLWPSIRAWLNRRMPPALGGSFFCAATCVSLFFTMEFWRPSRTFLWHLSGADSRAVFALFLASWSALTYSLWLTGFGFQTGFTPWWAWVLGRETPRRAFSPRGAFKILRHPVYMSFLGLVWFNPDMTIDRLTLALLWTTHIFVGSHLKDRRLERFIGEPYREYQARVPGYPLFRGPLGRRHPPRPTAAVRAEPHVLAASGPTPS
jgi:methanethiol S-methyltransferase